MGTVEAELVSTQLAAQQAGISITYFRQLANQPDTITPMRLRGAKVLLWTVGQVKEIAGRKKR